MLFSQRKGLKPAVKALQVGSMDPELRGAIWNCYFEIFLKKFEGPEDYPYGGAAHVIESNMESYFKTLWDHFFRLPTDTMPDDIGEVRNFVREFVFAREWNEVYDFVEFNMSTVAPQVRDSLKKCWNMALERDNAGYRIVDDRVAEITNADELAEIDEAIASPVGAARQHLQAALRLLSDRRAPDYRNSIKESISAVESVCRALTGKKNATLGDALDTLASKVPLHGALKRAFSSNYGYTSDEGGIRHAMLDEPALTFSDAKFMLLACSGFVNYIIGKASEAAIVLHAAV